MGNHTDQGQSETHPSKPPTKTKPSDFTNFPFDSVECKSEAETIALNIMVILDRTGNTFRELTWQEYMRERLRDSNFSEGEFSYFNRVISYCKSPDTANLFSKAWADEEQRGVLAGNKALSKHKGRAEAAENALMHIGNFVSADDVDEQLRGAVQNIINGVLFPEGSASVSAVE